MVQSSSNEYLYDDDKDYDNDHNYDNNEDNNDVYLTGITIYYTQKTILQMKNANESKKHKICINIYTYSFINTYI